MATAPKEAANTIALEEIHTEGPEPPKGGFVLAGPEMLVLVKQGRGRVLALQLPGPHTSAPYFFSPITAAKLLPVAVEEPLVLLSFSHCFV